MRLGVKSIVFNGICNPCGTTVTKFPHECGQWVWSEEEREKNALEQARLVSEYKEELEKWESRTMELNTYDHGKHSWMYERFAIDWENFHE